MGELISIAFSDLFPVKLIVVIGLISGEALFFTLGSNYAFGLWYGLGVALALNGVLVAWASEVNDGEGKDKVAWRASAIALVRLLIYGLALVLATLTEWLSFFAAAGGVLLPVFTLRLSEAFKINRFGG